MILLSQRIAGLAMMAALTVMLMTGRAWAQTYDPQTGDPPPGQHAQYTSNEWKVAPTDDGKGISGNCRLDCFQDEYDEVLLRLKGLQKDAKYTVWMVNENKGETGERAGVAQHWDGPEAQKFYFKSESDGKAYYHGWLSRCPLGKWKWLEVRYHPNGNVKDIEGSVVVLRVRIKPQ